MSAPIDKETGKPMLKSKLIEAFEFESQRANRLEVEVRSARSDARFERNRYTSLLNRYHELLDRYDNALQRLSDKS